MADYNKKPLWQWVVIYLVIGLILYAVVYFVFIKGNFSNSYQTSPNNQKMPKSNSLY